MHLLSPSLSGIQAQLQAQQLTGLRLPTTATPFSTFIYYAYAKNTSSLRARDRSSSSQILPRSGVLNNQSRYICAGSKTVSLGPSSAQVLVLQFQKKWAFVIFHILVIFSILPWQNSQQISFFFFFLATLDYLNGPLE